MKQKESNIFQYCKTEKKTTSLSDTLKPGHTNLFCDISCDVGPFDHFQSYYSGAVRMKMLSC